LLQLQPPPMAIKDPGLMICPISDNLPTLDVNPIAIESSFLYLVNVLTFFSRFFSLPTTRHPKE
jgi:hypothetical protein